jgi:hypothetical protein
VSDLNTDEIRAYYEGRKDCEADIHALCDEIDGLRRSVDVARNERDIAETKVADLKHRIVALASAAEGIYVTSIGRSVPGNPKEIQQ